MKGTRHIENDPESPTMFLKYMEWDPDTVPKDKEEFKIECDCGYKGKAKREGKILTCPNCKYSGELKLKKGKKKAKSNKSEK